MCRYDHSVIVEEQSISDESKLARFDPDLQEQFRRYRFVIEGDHCTVDRWRSFGVTPIKVEKQ